MNNLKELLENYFFSEKNEKLFLRLLNDSDFLVFTGKIVKISRDLGIEIEHDYRFIDIEDAIDNLRNEILNEQS